MTKIKNGIRVKGKYNSMVFVTPKVTGIFHSSFSYEDEPSKIEETLQNPKQYLS